MDAYVLVWWTVGPEYATKKYERFDIVVPGRGQRMKNWSIPDTPGVGVNYEWSAYAVP